MPPRRLPALRWLLLAGALSLAACQYLPLPPQPPAPAGALPELDRGAAQAFRVDPARSVIQLKVYRDGMLARLGHNHVIAVSQITGSVYRREPLSASTFELQFPVAALLVDRPADRRRAGAEFPGEIPPQHIEATRSNMLGPQLLQAERYPTVELRALALEGRGAGAVWRVAVRVRDRVAELRVPVHLGASGGELIAQGAMRLSQRELGLQPFCALGGKLCVRDEIDAEFYLVAAPS